MLTIKEVAFTRCLLLTLIKCFASGCQAVTRLALAASRGHDQLRQKCAYVIIWWHCHWKAMTSRALCEIALFGENTNFFCELSTYREAMDSFRLAHSKQSVQFNRKIYIIRDIVIGESGACPWQGVIDVTHLGIIETEHPTLLIDTKSSLVSCYNFNGSLLENVYQKYRKCRI